MVKIKKMHQNNQFLMKRVKTLNGRKEKKKSKYFSSFSGRPWTWQKVKVGAVSVFQRLLHRCHGRISVVYFDQQTHAYTCIHMLENKEKCLKIVKSTFFIIRTRDSRKAHTRTWVLYFYFFKDFRCSVRQSLLSSLLLTISIRDTD